ncbi:hypothetical protein MRB53_039871 [Persea americana]|nr:hypothetical protein MRB53_039871 [Persea americana]
MRSVFNASHSAGMKALRSASGSEACVTNTASRAAGSLSMGISRRDLPTSTGCLGCGKKNDAPYFYLDDMNLHSNQRLPLLRNTDKRTSRRSLYHKSSGVSFGQLLCAHSTIEIHQSCLFAQDSAELRRLLHNNRPKRKLSKRQTSQHVFTMARRMATYALLTILSSYAHAQGSINPDLPNLSTISGVAGASTTGITSGIASNSAQKTASATSYGLANQPTLAGVGVPPLIVPDTSAAPYMQVSNLPEGTVFICVGAALGFLGLCVLSWRVISAWALQRSVNRASRAAYPSDTKAPLYQAVTGTIGHGYKGSYVSTRDVSMDRLAGRHSYTAGSMPRSSSGTRAHRGSGTARSKHVSRQHASQLFFSPTAGAGAPPSANRSSSYLPAGYYAPGAAAPAGGTVLSVGGDNARGVERQCFRRSRNCRCATVARAQIEQRWCGRHERAQESVCGRQHGRNEKYG